MNVLQLYLDLGLIQSLGRVFLSRFFDSSKPGLNSHKLITFLFVLIEFLNGFRFWFSSDGLCWQINIFFQIIQTI